MFRFAVCEFPFVFCFLFLFFWFKAFWCVAAFLAHSNVKTIFKLLGRKLDHATVLERFSGDTEIVCLNTESIFVLLVIFRRQKTITFDQRGVCCDLSLFSLSYLWRHVVISIDSSKIFKLTFFFFNPVIIIMNSLLLNFKKLCPAPLLCVLY